MPTAYADLERMYDGPIPREEIARCVEPKAVRFTVADSGRILMRGGIPMADAIDATPALMRRIADLLNQHGEG